MPLYDFTCDRGHMFERFVKLEDFEDQQYCSCGAASSRVISTPMFNVDNTGYTCPVTDRWIGSRREHAENLKLTGCRVLESGEKEANQAARVAADQEFDRKVEETVEKQWESLPSDKREKIGAELTAGVTVEPVRQSA